jgi:hypothetical protein
MADDSNPGDLFKIKVDGTGAELAVGNKVPSLIERFLPSSWTSGKKIDNAINDNILRKIGADQVLDDGELDFLSTVLSERAHTLLRQRSIQARALTYVEQSPVQKLLAASSSDKNTEESATSDQWITRLREDTGGVNSEELSDLYARILAEECRHPNSVSLRTLGVLRYLDGATLMAFEKLQAIVVDDYTPRYQENGGIFDYFSISHDEVLMLEDVGLISLAATSLSFPEGPSILPVRAYGVSFIAKRKAPIDGSLRITPLTLAGRELSRISQRKEHKSDLPQIGNWILHGLKVSHNLFYVDDLLDRETDIDSLALREWIIDAE